MSEADAHEAAARAALDAAVEHAYATFAGYKPGREQVSVCRCGQCIQPESEFVLLNAPLRDIDHYPLADYTYAANREGEPGFDPNELRYFLPRMLDLVAQENPPCFSEPEPTLRRLRECKYRETWPAAEVAAVDDFYSALMAERLSAPTRVWTTRNGDLPSSEDVGDILCMIVIGGGDLARLLGEWDANPDQRATHHLAAQILGLKLSEDCGTGFSTAFWSNDTDARDAFHDWLLRPQAVAKLERAMVTERDPRMRDWLAEARDFVTAVSPLG